MERPLAQFLLRHRFFVMLSIVALTLVGLHFVSKLSFDENIERALFKNEWDAYMRSSGMGEVLFVALSTGQPGGALSRKHVGALRQITRQVQALHHVESAISLATVADDSMDAPIVDRYAPSLACRRYMQLSRSLPGPHT